MYAYRHKIVFNGKLETGTPSAKLIGLEKTEVVESRPEATENLGQSKESENIIEQLRLLHSAVVRTKKLTVKSLVS